jgi:hypothetical protein
LQLRAVGLVRDDTHAADDATVNDHRCAEAAEIGWPMIMVPLAGGP